MTPDPAHVGANVGDPQSWNAYVYSRNDPINLIDPSGSTSQTVDWEWQCDALRGTIAGMWVYAFGERYSNGIEWTGERVLGFECSIPASVAFEQAPTGQDPGGGSGSGGGGGPIVRSSSGDRPLRECRQPALIPPPQTQAKGVNVGMAGSAVFGIGVDAGAGIILGKDFGVYWGGGKGAGMNVGASLISVGNTPRESTDTNVNLTVGPFGVSSTQSNAGSRATTVHAVSGAVGPSLTPVGWSVMKTGGGTFRISDVTRFLANLLIRIHTPTYMPGC